MDQEIKDLLQKNLELSRENNKLLRKMRRASIYGGIVKVIWWAIIFGVPVYLYFAFLQPYLVELIEVYESISDGVDNVQDADSRLPDIGGFLRGLVGGK